VAGQIVAREVESPARVARFILDRGGGGGADIGGCDLRELRILSAIPSPA